MPRYANDSFYTAMQLFTGIWFGAFEFALLTSDRVARMDVIALLLLAISSPVFLIGLKNKYSSSTERLFALSRPYHHIVADSLLSASTVSLLALIVFIYSRDLPFLEKGKYLTLHTGVLMLNILIFIASLLLYSHLAKTERARSSEPQKITKRRSEFQ